MDNMSWAVDECLGEVGEDIAPADLLEKLFLDPRCPAFGPDHHFIVGACSERGVHRQHGGWKGNDDDRVSCRRDAWRHRRPHGGYDQAE